MKLTGISPVLLVADLDRSVAIAELEQHAGTQFDPGVVEALLRVLARG